MPYVSPARAARDHLRRVLACRRLLCRGPGRQYMSADVMRDSAHPRQAGLLMPEESDCLVCHKEKGSHTAVLGAKRGLKAFVFADAVRAIAHPGMAGPAERVQRGAVDTLPGPKYVGAFVCASCHAARSGSRAYATWRKSAHAAAYAVLATPRAGEIARRHNIIIAIEPLRHQESNIINTGAEALQLVHEVHHPNIKMIIDYYHMRVENENPDIVWKARKEIVHFHFANPHGRLWPKSPAEDPEYGEFFKLVKKIHFHGGISIEARGRFAQDAAASLAFFREEIKRA